MARPLRLEQLHVPFQGGGRAAAGRGGLCADRPSSTRNTDGQCIRGLRFSDANGFYDFIKVPLSSETSLSHPPQAGGNEECNDHGQFAAAAPNRAKAPAVLPASAHCDNSVDPEGPAESHCPGEHSSRPRPLSERGGGPERTRCATNQPVTMADRLLRLTRKLRFLRKLPLNFPHKHKEGNKG